jgi:hypothetical protein
MFTIFDPGGSGIYAPMRGRMAVFNEWAREIADTHGATLVDMWRMREVDIAEVMDTDRMHLNPAGHLAIAMAVLDALGIEHALEPAQIAPRATPSRAQKLRENARWTREFLAPWVHRRLTGRSSGDGISPKRPTLLPI